MLLKPFHWRLTKRARVNEEQQLNLLTFEEVTAYLGEN